MNKLSVSQIKEIYHLLQDDLSRDIFKNRLMFSLTEDYRFIRDIALTVGSIDRIYKNLRQINGKIGIFGAGRVGARLVQTYKDIEFEYFIDNKKAGVVYENTPVISLKEFKEKYPNGHIIISTKLYYEEIFNQLLEEGWPEDQIINIGKEYAKLNHCQYFDLPYLKSVEKEVFVDGGCYDGNTAMDFKKWCLEKGVKDNFIYAWEPDYNNIEECKKRLNTCEMKYTFIPKGLWNERDVLQFNMEDTSSAISENGEVTIEVDSIDNVCKTVPTFIKMDIEGAEYKALLGAKEIISKYKPKLAICIYHKPEDIWELPILIHKMNPDYKFYLRHYSFADTETVLYAIE